eukprot:scaffold1033_cov171-Amphora_coffeaeformis.AAC.31
MKLTDGACAILTTAALAGVASTLALMVGVVNRGVAAHGGHQAKVGAYRHVSYAAASDRCKSANTKPRRVTPAAPRWIPHRADFSIVEDQGPIRDDHVSGGASHLGIPTKRQSRILAFVVRADGRLAVRRSPWRCFRRHHAHVLGTIPSSSQLRLATQVHRFA